MSASEHEDWIRSARAGFADAVDAAGPGPVLVMTHNDADGLASGALLARALERAGRPHEVRLVGRGENAWSDAMRAELAARMPAPGLLLVADLGTRPFSPLPGIPAVVLDHHVARPGEADGRTLVLSGLDLDPVPPTSLLAFWCAGAIAELDDLLWLAGMGIVGDLGERAPFAVLASARKRFGAGALREATSLVNAPRRSAAGDARPAFAILRAATDPKDLLSGRHDELAALQAARDAVRAALEAARKIGPRIRGDVALIRLHTPFQVHPMVAQSWTGRLRDKIVIAANTGFREGGVHFAARTATGTDLVRFFAERAPANADENYGGGHAQASGGALPLAEWNRFVAALGFGEEMTVAA